MADYLAVTDRSEVGDLANKISQHLTADPEVLANLAV